jgi:hypothetical protein
LLVNSSFSAIVRTSAVLVMPVAIVCPSFVWYFSWPHDRVAAPLRIHVVTVSLPSARAAKAPIDDQETQCLCG